MTDKREGSRRHTSLDGHGDEMHSDGLSYGAPSPMAQSGHLQALAIAALVTALVTGLAVVIDLLSPNAAWGWLPVSVFLISLEAVYTGRWLAHPQRRHVNRSLYRIAEFAVIALALRLLTWTLSGGIPGWRVWRGYLLSPLTFFDGLYTGFILCGLLAWERTSVFSTLLRGLTISGAEQSFYAMPREEQKDRSHDRPLDRQRPHIFRALVSTWLGGGLLLAVAAAVSTVDVTTLSFEEGLRTVARLGLHPIMLLSLFVYFLLGLWLVSEARLEMLRARWLVDGVKAIGQLVTNWRRTSLVVIALVSIIAAFLPIGSTFAAAILLQTVFSLALIVAQLLFVLFTTLFVGLLTMLGIGAPPGELTPIPEAAQPPPPPAADAPLSESAALVFGGAFWLLVAAAATIALVYFLRDRGFVLHHTSFARLLQRLLDWLTTLRSGAAERATTVRTALIRRLHRLIPADAATRTPWRFLSVNRLPPRDQIRYFYLSTVRRAADEGVSRENSETPSEFARDLRAQWPGASEEIDALTGAFQEARYSGRHFEKEEVDPVKKIWKRVRRTIRHNWGP